MQKKLLSFRHLILFSLLFITFLSCAQNESQQVAKNSRANTFTKGSCYLSTKFIEHDNLRIYPILLKQGIQSAEDFLSLAKGLSDKSVKITEKSSKGNENTNELSDAAEVNKLFIQNNSTDTLFLLGGEVIKGGKQDRTIAADVIVPPNGKAYDIDVFCVEHGRWSADEEKGATKYEFSSAKPMVKASVRKEAVIAKSQTKVWDKVSEANNAAGNYTLSDNYNSFEDNKEYKKKEKIYLAFFKEKINDQENIIGFIAVTKDKVFAADVFVNEKMLKQRLDLLLPSYINEAIVDGAPVNIKKEKVEAYANNLLSDETTQEKFLKKNGKLFKVGKKKVHISSY